MYKPNIVRVGAHTVNMKKSIKIIIKAGIAAAALSTVLAVSACGNSASAGISGADMGQSVIERPTADEDLTISPAAAGKKDEETHARGKGRRPDGKQDKRRRPLGADGENGDGETGDGENDGKEKSDRPMRGPHERAIMLILVPAREGFMPPPHEISEGTNEEPETESTVRGAPTSND